jgi:hypothetical protein
MAINLSSSPTGEETDLVTPLLVAYTCSEAWLGVVPVVVLVEVVT